MPKYVVAARDEIPAGGRKLLTINGHSIGVFNIDGEFYAMRDRCPHQGYPLCQGQLWGPVQASIMGTTETTTTGPLLRCPFHGWEFDVRTGQSWFDLDRQHKRRFPVSMALVATELQKGNYQAKMYPVSVDEQGISVDLGDI